MRRVLSSLIGVGLFLGLCGCGPGGVAVLAALLAGGGGGGGKKHKGVALRIVSQYGAPSPGTGVHYYSPGTEVTVSCGTTPFPSADPADGTRYICTGYTATGSGLSNGTDLRFTFIIDEDTTIEWLWRVQHKVTVGVNDAAMGSASMTDVQNGQRDGDYIDEGATVEITATPNEGYEFDRWSVDATGTDNPVSLQVDGPKTVIANFKIRQVTLKVDSSGRGSPDPPEGDNAYDWGTTLSCSVDAYADDGQPTRYKCVGWIGTGDVPATGGTNDTGPITLKQDSSITWQWQTQYEVTVTSSGSGSATITDVSGTWEGDYVEEGSKVEITATPSVGNVLDYWEVNSVNVGDNNPLTITADGPKDVVAHFRAAVAPVADFTWSPDKPLVGKSVQFTDTSTGDIDTWNWDFGDGGTSNEQNPTHTYGAAGVYTVKLSVSGPAGNNEVTYQIAVYDGNVYVDDTGSDTNYGTSWSDALATIQAGIDTADPSQELSTVLVGDGVYVEANIDFGGKAITVKSDKGPRNCVIDCRNNGRAFWFHTGETESSVLDGFTIMNGSVSGSGVDGCGGGVLCSAGVSPTIKNCVIRDCCASASGTSNETGCGGAIGITGGAHPTIMNCRIEKNLAEERGGGIFCFGDVPDTTPIKIINTVIIRNTGQDNGYGAGGVLIWGVSPTEPCNVEMINCTVTANRAELSSGGGIYVLFMGKLSLKNSIVWGNNTGDPSGYADIDATGSNAVADVYNCCVNNKRSGGTINYNGQNIFKDPRMIAPDFGNCNLDYTSPCIDAGGDSLVPSTVTEDITGRPRFVDGDEDGNKTVDMGAYEFRALEVPTDYGTIQDAINSAEEGDTVLVFPGSYNEWNLNLKGKGVVVRGVGGAPAVMIDAGMNGRVFSLTNNEPRDAAIVGLTISNGGSVNMGGGIACFPASPVIKGCVIESCSVTYAGGGILVRNSASGVQSDAVIINCEVSYNKTGNISQKTYGGGIAVMKGATAIIFHCVISDNEAGATNNGDGGGLFCDDNSYVELRNCLISDNDATGAGGGLHAFNNAHMEVVNCTIAYNSSGSGALSIHLNGATANVTNCIVWTDTGGTQISSGANVNYSCVEGGWAGGTGNIGGNAGEEPQFVDPASENYHLLDGTKCKDAGDNSAVKWDKDLDGRRRIWGTVDMGCYEGEWLVVGVAPNPYTDISSAITAAEDGDVVALRDQTFSGAGNVNLDPGGKLLWIRSFSLDPTICIIDGGDTDWLMRISNNETEDLVIEGIGFQNGDAVYGGAVYIDGASPIFKNVIIRDNSASSNGGGVYIADGSPTFINCLIADNQASSYGGGIYGQNSVTTPPFTITFINCTITNNDATSNGGGIYTHNWANDKRMILINCIVYGNRSGGTYHEAYAEFPVDAYYSDINTAGCSNRVTLDSYSIEVDPDFANPTSGDYHLDINSPCIDAGNWRAVTSLFDIEQNPRVLGSSVDMGCYEK